MRRLLGLALLLFAGIFALRIYVLHVYAPGLRQEARLVPALVREQLRSHGSAYVPLGQTSQYLQLGIIAIEDRRFYQHPGIDPLGILRASWVNITNQHVDQGGSTLEEQLVKRAIMYQDRTIRLKLRTMALAWAIDQDFTKRRILELYLNAAYYGRGAYGAGAAAHIYFGTDAGHLNVAQAAFLAALPQAPSTYGANPHSPAVVGRQHTVLLDMEQAGFITAQQRQEAESAPLLFAFVTP